MALTLRIRKRFTGYEKDDETGLDFAEARMYQSLNGRFNAIDPLLASGKSANPQTFNRYVYVMNQPLTLTDPTGLQAATKPPEKGRNTGFCIFSCNFVDEPYERTVLGEPDAAPSYGFTDALSDTGEGLAKGVWNRMAAISNAFYWTAEKAAIFSGPDFRIHRTPYWEASNQTQVNADIALTGVSIYSGAFTGGASSAAASAPAASRFTPTAAASSETTTMFPVSSLEFTNRVTGGGLKNAYKFGQNEPIKVISVEGRNIVADGNHRTALALHFKKPEIAGQNVTLPYGSFKTTQELLDSVIPKTQVTQSSAMRFFKRPEDK